MVFEAACANCDAWTGSCGRGLAPPAGEPRCDQYQISDAFASELAGLVLRETPLHLPIPLRPLTASERRKVAKRPAPRARRGFRS